MHIEKCKVLLCSPLDLSSGSGISRWCHHIKNYYESHGSSTVDLSVFSMDRTVYIDESMNFVKRAFLGLKDYSQIIRNICRDVSTHRYDVVHIASSASISLFKDLLLLRRLSHYNVNTILHFHFGRIPALFACNNWEWKLLCKVAKYCTKIVVIDQLSYETLLQAGFSNVMLLPNPLSPQVSEIIAHNGTLVREPRTILFAGHVYRTKGVYELVEACALIPDIRLRIVGKYDDSIKQELVGMASRHKSSSWLEFTGNLPFEQVVKEMLRCSVFVLPTYTEGFPNVILESMACACPIVTTNVGAIPEMLDIANGDYCGKCVFPQQIESLREAILSLLDNPTYAAECGNNARLRVNSYYSMPVVWSSMQDLWLHVVPHQ